MSLRINTNTSAINAHNSLQSTDKALSKSMAKLSSGYRINSASDDAAGLAIANRLRTNSRSLTVASRNVTEAKAMLSIAEGAANQVESILERMKDLATQAASDNVGASDKTKINNEFTQLLTEVTRIVTDTDYQGTKLIDGTFGATATSGTPSDFTDAEIHLSGAAAGTYTMAAAAGTVTLTNGVVTQQVNFTAGSPLNFNKLGISIDTQLSDSTTNLAGDIITVGAGASGTYQVGTGNVSTEDQIDILLGNLTTGATGLNIAALNLSTKAGAQSALGTLDTAIDTVSTNVANIGAYMNRMDYAYSAISVTIENFQASESVIRDADMAGEMVSFTKSQILLQAGTAMLAQANTSSQGILSLMR